MSLESKIKQSKFKTPEHKLAINILYTSHWINYLIQNHFKNQEITHQQYNVLRILRGQYPNTCNLRLIKERMLDAMSDASRIVDKLIKKGFVVKAESNTDRRNLNLIISEKGLKLLESLDHVDETFIELFKHLDKNDINSLNFLLDKLHDKNSSSAH